MSIWQQQELIYRREIKSISFQEFSERCPVQSPISTRHEQFHCKIFYDNLRVFIQLEQVMHPSSDYVTLLDLQFFLELDGFFVDCRCSIERLIEKPEALSCVFLALSDTAYWPEELSWIETLYRTHCHFYEMYMEEAMSLRQELVDSIAVN